MIDEARTQWALMSSLWAGLGMQQPAWETEVGRV